MAEKPSAEILSLDAKYRGWCTVFLATVRLADGRTITRVVEDHGNAACVLPYNPERRTAIVIRQLRAPLLYAAQQQSSLEAVAGVIDAGETGDVAAKREAGEEAALRLRALEPVATVATMPGVSTERMSMFLAEYRATDRVGAGGGVAGENEDIEVIEMPLRVLAEMADGGTLTDLKTFTLVQTLRLRKPALFG